MIYNELCQQFPHMNIKLNDPLAQYSFTKTGGPADAVVFPESIEQVQAILTWVQAQQVPLTILGNLSNLIVSDRGIDGVVMILTEMNQIQVIGNELIAQSGATIIEASQIASEHALSGLEFACGIPGSVGGAVFMNAGAYGGEIKDVPAIEVETITRTGELKTYQLADCEFAYRYSVFQENGEIILQAKLTLTPGDQSTIQAKMNELTELRQSRQPLEYPSCGSVFKRPEGHYTGQLIQEAGLQGYRIGGAEISKKHAGFIVNRGGATATDYIEMIHHIQAIIWERNQVRLEPEVRIIGRL